MSERALLPGESAVLGLLAIRPMHGYEMARFFDRDELTEVCPIEQSLLYSYLRNVEERGLVKWSEVRVGARPPRKKYRITSAGRTSLDEWLRAPVDRIREVRLAFLLKLYFLHELDPEGEKDLLRRQIEICGEYKRRMEARLAASADFERLVVRSKIAAAEGTEAWLRSYAAELDAAAVPGGGELSA